MALRQLFWFFNVGSTRTHRHLHGGHAHTHAHHHYTHSEAQTSKWNNNKRSEQKPICPAPSADAQFSPIIVSTPVKSNMWLNTQFESFAGSTSATQATDPEDDDPEGSTQAPLLSGGRFCTGTGELLWGCYLLRPAGQNCWACLWPAGCRPPGGKDMMTGCPPGWGWNLQSSPPHLRCQIPGWSTTTKNHEG